MYVYIISLIHIKSRLSITVLYNLRLSNDHHTGRHYIVMKVMNHEIDVKFVPGQHARKSKSISHIFIVTSNQLFPFGMQRRQFPVFFSTMMFTLYKALQPLEVDCYRERGTTPKKAMIPLWRKELSKVKEKKKNLERSGN